VASVAWASPTGAPPAALKTETGIEALNQTATHDLESRQWQDSWSCGESRAGVVGLAGLQKIHAGFNHVFGDPKLRIAMNQCYTAKCHGLYFAVCNAGSGAVTEVPNARNEAKNKDPKNGYNCAWSPFKNMYQPYYFGTGSLDLDSRRWKQDIRNC